MLRFTQPAAVNDHVLVREGTVEEYRGLGQVGSLVPEPWVFRQQFEYSEELRLDLVCEFNTNVPTQDVTRSRKRRLRSLATECSGSFRPLGRLLVQPFRFPSLEMLARDFSGNSLAAIELFNGVCDFGIDHFLVLHERLDFSGLRSQSVVNYFLRVRESATLNSLLDELFILRGQANGHTFNLSDPSSAGQVRLAYPRIRVAASLPIFTQSGKPIPR